MVKKFKCICTSSKWKAETIIHTFRIFRCLERRRFLKKWTFIVYRNLLIFKEEKCSRNKVLFWSQLISSFLIHQKMYVAKRALSGYTFFCQGIYKWIVINPLIKWLFQEQLMSQKSSSSPSPLNWSLRPN